MDAEIGALSIVRRGSSKCQPRGLYKQARLVQSAKICVRSETYRTIRTAGFSTSLYCLPPDSKSI